jgi:hypothetical protein
MTELQHPTRKRAGMFPAWHRLMKEHGRAVLSGRKAPEPGKGVWVANLDSTGTFQLSREAIAVDGRIVWQRDCWCGQDRAFAHSVAADYLFGRR